MALPITFDLQLYAGDSERFVIRWKELDNSPKDLVGAEAVMQLKRDRSQDPLLSITGVVSETNAEVTFDLSPSETTALLDLNGFNRQTYLYDVQYSWPDGTVTTVVDGKCFVHLDVTRV